MRIFGIGLSRTGTTSLTHALVHVGINMIHYPTKKQLFDPAIKAAADIPVARYFKELDVEFPNSKFIYTTRNKDRWLVSMEGHFTKYKLGGINEWFKENRREVYGSLEFDKDLYAQVFDSHDKAVREYFKDKDNLLILNITAGDGWDELLSFLELSDKKITIDFPHKRRTAKNKNYKYLHIENT